MLKKILKIGFIVLSILTMIIVVLFAIFNEPLPEIIKNSGTEADKMAMEMQSALHYNDFKNTQFVEWSFQNGNNVYFWNKQRQVVTVKWDDIVVDLNLKRPKQSKATKDNFEVKGTKKDNLIVKASKNFNNDSFWLVAPFKLFDSGTERKLVQLEDGSKGLLVTYNSGGNTPGDSYLWKVDKTGFPKSYQMWVSIIPIGGLEATWEGWQKMESGAYLPTAHKIGPITLSMGDVKAYN